MTATIHEPSPQDTPTPAFPGSDPAELAALARLFSEHLSPRLMRRMGKWDRVWTEMADVLDARMETASPCLA